MSDVVIDWSSRGGEKVVNQAEAIQRRLQKTRSAIQALDADSKGLANFAKSLGLSFKESERFSKALGLTGAELDKAFRKLQGLNSVNATAQQRFAVLSKETKLTADQFLALDKAVRQYNDRIDEQVAANQRAAAAQSDQVATAKRAAQAEQELAREKAAAAKASLQIAAAESRLAIALRGNQDAIAAVTRAFGGNAVQAERAVVAYLKLQRAGASTSSIQVQLTRQLGVTNSQFKQLDSTIGALKQEAGGLDAILTGIGQGIGQQALQLSIQLIQSLARAIQDFVVSSIQASTRLTNFENKLIIATGSAQAAGEELDFVRSVVDDLGLNLESSIDGFSRLATAAKGTQFAGQGVRDIFEGVSAAASGLNLSADETAGIFRALEQIISKGKVQAEELRGQLGDRLSGAFQAFAAGLGLTTTQLDDLLKQGEITADQLLPFADELQERFGSLDLESPTKSLNRLGNEVFDIQAGFGKSLEPAFVASVELLTDTLQKAGELRLSMQQQSDLEPL